MVLEEKQSVGQLLNAPTSIQLYEPVCTSVLFKSHSEKNYFDLDYVTGCATWFLLVAWSVLIRLSLYLLASGFMISWSKNLSEIDATHMLWKEKGGGGFCFAKIWSWWWDHFPTFRIYMTDYYNFQPNCSYSSQFTIITPYETSFKQCYLQHAVAEHRGGQAEVNTHFGVAKNTSWYLSQSFCMVWHCIEVRLWCFLMAKI